MSGKKIAWRVLGAGVALGTVLVVAHIAVAEIPADAKIMGQKMCVACHQATHKELTAQFLKSAHPKALMTPDEEGAIVAVFDADSPVNKADIQYVIGKGNRHQAYVGKDGKTMAAEWNTAQKKWVPHPVVDAVKDCIPCHVTGMDMAKGAWVDKGVTCEACHGPGSAHATTGDKTKIGQNSLLPADKQAMVCGRCHSVGTTKDGLHKFPLGLKYGEDLSKVFTLAPVTGPKMNQQYNEWLESKHGQMGIGCTVCHDVHGKGSADTAMLKKPEHELCSACHAPALAKATHPKVEAGAKCGMCHMPQGMHTFKVPGKG